MCNKCLWVVAVLLVASGCGPLAPSLSKTTIIPGASSPADRSQSNTIPSLSNDTVPVTVVVNPSDPSRLTTDPNSTTVTITLSESQINEFAKTGSTQITLRGKSLPNQATAWLTFRSTDSDQTYQQYAELKTQSLDLLPPSGITITSETQSQWTLTFEKKPSLDIANLLQNQLTAIKVQLPITIGR